MTALLVSLLLAQPLLVGAAEPCVDHATSVTSAGSHGAMSGAMSDAMPNAGVAPGRDADTRGARRLDCATGGDRAPCGLPSAPGGGGCLQMSACAAAPMIVETPATLAFPASAERAVAAPVTAPFSLAPAPDVPPPRA